MALVEAFEWGYHWRQLVFQKIDQGKTGAVAREQLDTSTPRFSRPTGIRGEIFDTRAGVIGLSKGFRDCRKKYDCHSW